ncbi:MAG: peptidoglycan LD-endopeptidase CwlK [Patescibacteria group bacterium]|nr:peptidoglycan LD-endopeptidase CwlK [Patescibacteria group bacterium]
MLPDQSLSSIYQALLGLDIPSSISDSLALIEVPYVTFDNREEKGQLVIHQELAEEVTALFEELYNQCFPINKMVPLVEYGWDDVASMADNNTSAFNYRKIIATDLLSNHALGRAIDINPLQNPYYALNGEVYPANAIHDPSVPGTLHRDSAAVFLFKEKGWTWLGDRDTYKDYQHFEKL